LDDPEPVGASVGPRARAVTTASAVATATGAQAPSSSGSAPARRLARPSPELCLWALVVLGVVLRARQYAARGSLWTDEARLSLDIEHLGFAGLTRPLPLLQGGPYGYLWAERLCDLVFGTNEYSLRLVSFIAGLAALFLFRLLARKLLPAWPACLAMAIVAISPNLVFFSSQVKPYNDDVAAGIAIVLIGLWVLDGDLDPRRLGVWAGATTLLVLFSYGAAIVGGAVAIALFADALRRRRPRSAGLVAAGVLPWGGLFVLQYLVALRPIADTKFMRAFWAPGYDPHLSSLSATVHWLGSAVGAVMNNPFDFAPVWLAVVVMLVGLVALARRQGTAATLLVLVVLLPLAGGLLGRFPFDGRMVLFLVPFGAIALAAVTTLVTPGGTRRLALRLAVLAVVVAVVAPSAVGAAEQLGTPTNVTAFREAYLFARAHEAPGEPVYVDGLAAAQYVYYAGVLGLHASGTLNLSVPGRCSEARLDAKLAAAHRFWVVLGIPPGLPPGVPAYLRALSRFGHLEYHETSEGAGAVLVEVDRRFPGTSTRAQGCLSLAAAPSFAGLKRRLDAGNLPVPGRP
jgi:hypothetical protein